jgi:hypothetical protein
MSSHLERTKGEQMFADRTRAACVEQNTLGPGNCRCGFFDYQTKEFEFRPHHPNRIERGQSLDVRFAFREARKAIVEKMNND